jgi:hypothetical protein
VRGGADDLRSSSCAGCWWELLAVVFILFSVPVFFLYLQICCLFTDLLPLRRNYLDDKVKCTTVPLSLSYFA